MKKIKMLLFATMLSVAALGAAACGSKKDKDDVQEIVFVEEYDIPLIKLGQEYDFEPYFTKQKGVEYSMTAMYLDDDLNEVYLDVDGFKFTHIDPSDVFITITAKDGDDTYTGEMQIPVDMTYDKTDHWVVDSLFAGTGMTKKLNYLPEYRTSLDSLTSVRFAYKGSAAKTSPISAIPFIDWPNNSKLTVSDWSNAVITFDVFNSSPENIVFGFIMKHSNGISYSFDQCKKFVCEPNEWTHIEYSLKSLNYTDPFVFDSEYDFSDMIIAQAIYEGATEDSLYSYNFYVDNVDICDYSEEKFPDLDTTTYKEYEDFFTKDDALCAIVNDDYENSQKTNALYNYEELVEYSNKSLKMVLSQDGSAAHGFLHSFIGGNPTGWKPLDITDATMSFYIRPVNADKTFVLRFESDDNVFGNAIEIDLTQESGQGWTVSEGNDGWYKVSIDVDETNTETALVRTDFIRTMRLYFTNNTAEAGSESAIYLDTLILEGYKTSGVYGEDAKLDWETKSPYTSLEENDMFSCDDNLVLTVNGERQDNDMSQDIYERSENSNYSYKMVLPVAESSKAVVDSFFSGTPSDWTILDLSEATVSFDVKSVNADKVVTVAFASDFGDQGLFLGAKVAIDLTQASGEGWTVTALENGWYRITLDIKNAKIDDEAVGITKDFLKIMRVEFTNASAQEGSESAVYVDNLKVVDAKPTQAQLDEEKPWETKSPYINYTVTFLNSDGSLISQAAYHYGDMVVEPEAPSMDGMEYEGTFAFAGWDYTVTTVNGDATYKATYTGTISDLINTNLNQDTVDSLSYDTEVKSTESNRSLKVTAPWTEAENTFPYFNIEFDQYYDLSSKYVVFDLNKGNYDSWFAFDFVNNDVKMGLWTSLGINADSNEATHKCEALGEGWLRVYLNAAALAGGQDISNVNKLYVTIHSTKADASGDLEFHIDNLHFEELPNFTVSFVNYDGSEISSTEYKAGAAVVVPENPTRAGLANECDYIFAGWDKEVNSVALTNVTYTATYTATNIKDLINTNVDKDAMDAWSYESAVKSANSAQSLKVTAEWNKAGNQFPYFNITLDQYYDLSNKYMVFDINKNNYNSWFCVDFVNSDVKLNLWNTMSFNADTKEATHKCEDLGDGWLRVYVNAKVLAGDKDVSKVNKFYITVNNGNEGASGNMEFYIDNLHFEDIPAIPTYTITFKDYDGTVLSTAEYEEGATVVAPESPTRVGIANECDYIFAGWDYAVTAAEADATYTATYTATNIKDLFNCAVENGGIDSITNDTATKSENSAHSLHIVEPISSGNLPHFALTLDKSYDLTGKYMVFDTTINKDGWTVVFDFVNNNTKLGLWNMLTLKSGTNESTHKCEDLGNGWFRVYVDLDVLNGALNSVSKIYATLNASDGSGKLDIHFDNLHFENKPAAPEEPEVPALSEADDSISSCGFIAVNGGTMALDTDMVSSNSEKSVKCTVPAGNSGAWWNYDLDLSQLLGKGLDLSGKTITFDVKIVGNMTWVGFTVADGNGTYATPNGESYAWMNLSDGWSGFGMSIVSISDGWFRVSLAADTSFGGCSNNIAKLRFLVNPTDANESSFYIDNLYLGELKGYEAPTYTEADDKSSACGLVAVNGGTMALDTDTVSTNSEKSVKCTVPAGNSGVWWNYDLDLRAISADGVNLSGKTISFDLKIVGNMSLVGFTVADKNDTYAQPDGEGYVWTNLSDGWGADKGWVVKALDDGWFRISFTADTKFSGCSSNIAKLRFLVNPQDANESCMYIDNLYL